MGYVYVEKIAHVRLLCKKVLPAVYDESLSYLEGLSKLTFKLNETITSVNALNDNVSALNDGVIDLNTRVSALENNISSFEADMTARFNQLSAEINAQVDAKLADVEQRVSALESSIDSQISEFERVITERMNRLEREIRDLLAVEVERIYKLYTSFEIEMKAYVEKEVKDALKEIPDLTTVYVVDPTTGKLAKIQDAINNMFVFSAYNAFTCDEFNALGMDIDTANSIMVKSIPRGMTIYEWLHEAKKILLTQVAPAIAETFAYPHSIVRNYLDGSKIWHDKNVDINQALIAASGCYCCDELVTLAFTVNEIIGFNLTCYQYVMRANSLMVRE